MANGEYIKSMLDKTYKIDTLLCPAGAYPVKKLKVQGSKLKEVLYIGSKKVVKPYLLITNRHFAQKRFEYGIFALSSVLQKYPEYNLIITGKETDYTNEIEVLIKRLNLTNKVIFLNHVSESSLTKLYESCSVYLYTAPEEDFGMGIIEAMAQGAPVVAWNNAGPARIIDNGKTGLLARPFEVNNFADKTLSIVSDRSFAGRLGKNAYLQVKKKFSYDAHIRLLEKELTSQNKGYTK